MNYYLRVRNNYRETVEVLAQGTKINPGETKLINPSIRRTFIDIPGMQGISFMDLGKKRFGVYDPKSALLIKYTGKAYQLGSAGEYNNNITVIIDDTGQITLKTSPGFILENVNVPGITLKKTDE